MELKADKIAIENFICPGHVRLSAFPSRTPGITFAEAKARLPPAPPPGDIHCDEPSVW